MMGMGGMEVLVILMVAFILLGPSRMIEASRTLGKVVGQMRRLAEEIPHVDLQEIDGKSGNIDMEYDRRITSDSLDVIDPEFTDESSEDRKENDSPVRFRRLTDIPNNELRIDQENEQKEVNGGQDSRPTGFSA